MGEARTGLLPARLRGGSWCIVQPRLPITLLGATSPVLLVFDERIVIEAGGLPSTNDCWGVVK